MKIKKLFNYIKSLCKKCSYKLGLIQAVINPCPQCKLNKEFMDFKQTIIIWNSDLLHYEKMEFLKEIKDVNVDQI